MAEKVFLSNIWPEIRDDSAILPEYLYWQREVRKALAVSNVTEEGTVLLPADTYVKTVEKVRKIISQVSKDGDIEIAEEKLKKARLISPEYCYKLKSPLKKICSEEMLGILAMTGYGCRKAITKPSRYLLVKIHGDMRWLGNFHGWSLVTSDIMAPLYNRITFTSNPPLREGEYLLLDRQERSVAAYKTRDEAMQAYENRKPQH